MNINGDESNTYMLMSYVKLVSYIIDEYIHLIQQMLNTVGGSEVGIINHIINYLPMLLPQQTSSGQLGKNISIFKTVTKFLGLLAITEQGSQTV